MNDTFFSLGYTRRALVVLAMMLSGAGHVGAQEHFGTLLQELVDRDRLAMHPDDRYSQHQASSYDRRPTALGAPHSYANFDTANFIRSEIVNGQLEYVMLEDDGPGALTRWWMTGADNTNGQLRVYIDGQSSPVLSGTIEQLISGSESQFGDHLSYQTRPGIFSGHNLYAPIPYSQSIKVSYRGQVNDLPGFNPPVYYNINYRQYDGAVTTQSYTPGAPITHSATVASTNAALSAPAVSGNVGSMHSVAGQELPAGQSFAHQLAGGGAIRRLQVNVSGANQADALRNTYLELSFDGERTARVPVGHFFGNGNGSDSQAILPSTDFYRRVEADGDMTAFWVMPFESAAEVRLVNRGAQNVTVDLQVDSGAWQWDADSMHFHADGRAEKNIATRGGNGTTDWTFLNVRGRGSYVGDTLAIRNESNIWWGEGDEKIYIDYLDANGVGNNAQPDHIGTGTEDYYGYAWAHPETYHRAFIAQPLGAGNLSPGRSVNSRLRGLDAIPFDEALKFDMEILHNTASVVDFDATTYWYGAPGAKSLRVAADLGGDYRADLSLAEAGIPDRAGDGQWLYLSSSLANPSLGGAQTSLLSFGEVGNAGNEGYGGAQNGHNLAAIADDFLFVDGDLNQGVQGELGYHELALHPAGTVIDDGLFNGNAAQPFVVARWVAGESSAGLANITGSIRNFIPGGNGVAFTIYVDGQLQFSASASGSTLPERNFDFDATLTTGSIVDFVLGNNGQGNLFGDESLLNAMIWTDFEEFLPVAGDLDGNGTIDIADWIALRTNYNANLRGLAPQDAYARGDLNADFQSDEYDFALFKTAFEDAYGDGSFAALLSVPEPAASQLLAAVVGALTLRGDCPRRRRPAVAYCPMSP